MPSGTWDLSSLTRDRTHISHTGRQILNHWMTREVATNSFIYLFFNVAQSCLTLQPHGLYIPWNSSGQNTGVGSWSLLKGIFPTQGSNPGLSHCRRILYQLSHKGSPRILEWIVYPLARGSSHPRNRISVSGIVGGF